MALKDMFDGQAIQETADLIVPLHEEELVVGRRRTPGDTVRVHLTTRLREQLVDEVLTHESVEIERVAIGRTIDDVPTVREEGDVTIFPVVEEVVVVERRLVLKEEIRLRRVRTSEPYRETAVLRVQHAEISREPPGSPTPETRGAATLNKEHHDE